MNWYLSVFVGVFLGAVSLEAQPMPPACMSVSSLIDRAEKSNDSIDRERLLSSLRTSAGGECAPIFLSVLRTDRARDIQNVAAEVLIALANENVIAGIVDALHKSPNSSVRARLAGVVQNISAPGAVLYLAQALIQSPDEALWASVPLALGRIGTPESVRQLVKISEQATMSDWSYIVQGFAQIRNEAVLSEIQKVFESGAQDPIREGIALALGNYDKSVAFAPIESYLGMETQGRVREALQVSRRRILGEANREPR